MGAKYTFVAKGLDVDDDNIDDEVNTAAEEYAAKKGIVHYLITDFFNEDDNVRINIEDVGE